MPHLENGSREARAITIACAKKRLEEGDRSVRLAGIINAAFRGGVIDPETLAKKIGSSVKTVRKWTKRGCGPNRKTEIEVLKIIISTAEPK